MGPYWAIHWGSGIIKRLRTPALESQHMQNIERFVVLMYSKRCGLAKDNEARYYLCTTGRRTLENIPRTQVAPF